MPARNFDCNTLDLLAVIAEDSGVYSCQAISQFGEAITSCTLKCKCKFVSVFLSFKFSTPKTINDDIV
jgi:hypothetical protein